MSLYSVLVITQLWVYLELIWHNLSIRNRVNVVRMKHNYPLYAQVVKPWSPVKPELVPGLELLSLCLLLTSIGCKYWWVILHEHGSNSCDDLCFCDCFYDVTWLLGRGGDLVMRASSACWYVDKWLLDILVLKNKQTRSEVLDEWGGEKEKWTNIFHKHLLPITPQTLSCS